MRPRVMCVAAAAVALFATACGSTGGKPTEAAPTAAGATGFPVRVADCAGHESTFSGAPKKIVTSNASSLEMLLELGAGDRVIGTGFPPGKGYLPTAVADQGAKVPVLGQTVISKEKLLGSGADLYVDTFGAMNAMGGGAGSAPTWELSIRPEDFCERRRGRAAGTTMDERAPRLARGPATSPGRVRPMMRAMREGRRGPRSTVSRGPPCPNRSACTPVRPLSRCWRRRPSVGQAASRSMVSNTGSRSGP
jgi:hypothetical protein